MSASDDPIVAALLRERAGYVTRGLDERVAAVDEQLKARGHDGDKPEGDGPGPVRRGRPPRSSADQAAKDRA